MAYFKYLPKVYVRNRTIQEGNHPYQLTRNIFRRIKIKDHLLGSLLGFTQYSIGEGERPDQLSQRLYGTPNHHWTFFLINDKLKERGWPVSNREILKKAAKDYPYYAVTTQTPIGNIFKIGQTITGSGSGTQGTVNHRHVDLGQIVLSNLTGGTGAFIVGETISSVNADNVTESAVLTGASLEYNSAHHFVNGSSETVDINPTTGLSYDDTPVALAEVTYIDRLVNQNDDLKAIRVIKPGVMADVIKSFRQAISN